MVQGRAKVMMIYSAIANFPSCLRLSELHCRSAKLGTETLVFLDLGSRQNNDTAQLRSVLEKKLRQGQLGMGGGLDVREPGDNWFRVISGPGQSVSP